MRISKCEFNGYQTTIVATRILSVGNYILLRTLEEMGAVPKNITIRRVVNKLGRVMYFISVHGTIVNLNNESYSKFKKDSSAIYNKLIN